MDFQEYEYEVGKWYGWNGGECPVHPKSKVRVVVEGAKVDKRDCARDYCWGYNSVDPRSNIVAFRVVKHYVEPPKPQEFWVNVYEDGSIGNRYETKEKAVANCSAYRRHRTFKVREVIEE